MPRREGNRRDARRRDRALKKVCWGYRDILRRALEDHLATEDDDFGVMDSMIDERQRRYRPAAEQADARDAAAERSALVVDVRRQWRLHRQFEVAVADERQLHRVQQRDVPPAVSFEAFEIDHVARHPGGSCRRLVSGEQASWHE